MLQVLDLQKSYQTGKVTYPVLKGISFSIDDGEFAAVMGSSVCQLVFPCIRCI